MPVMENGQRFERYRIVRHLGNGVSGESYEAEDTTLQRQVTLKIVHPWMPPPESARRQFFRQLQGLSLPDHPYLAAILDYGEIDGRLYVVRQYVNRGSLLSAEGRLEYKPPFRLADAILYTYQLAQVLHYIHAHGCVHGAVTLSNILVQPAANSKRTLDFTPFLLADVGLSDFVRRFGQTVPRQLAITAAPEQYSKPATVASDQFALAVLLYFWLAGRPPYLGPAEEVQQLKLNETIPQLSAFNPGVTAEQENILGRALAAYSGDRFPSILAFADALIASIIAPAQSTTIPHTEPTARAAMTHTSASVAMLQPRPTCADDSLLALQPGPQPAPEPLPQPAPEPLPVPAPEPLPQPAPEPLPPPGPDVYQPHPQPEPEPAAAGPRFISPRLIISFARRQEHDEFLLEQKETWLGRAGSDDILLNADTSTSRHHALLIQVDDQYVLYDQRSSNGVFVNDQKLGEADGHILVDGDHVRIGSYELVFRCFMPPTPALPA